MIRFIRVCVNFFSPYFMSTLSHISAQGLLILPVDVSLAQMSSSGH